MFEAYTQRARRVIFFARYESSQFGSEAIESEHLLLGLIREDKNLVHRFLPGSAPLEGIRQKIEGQTTIREKVSTSIDLPLSTECKRILAYANEEGERLGNRHIGTEHLFLGILRESGCLAARVLAELGVIKADEVRNQLAKEPPEQELEELIEPPPPVDRPSIHELVDKLPEDALRFIKHIMDQVLASPHSWPLMAHGELHTGLASTVRRDPEGKVLEGHFSSCRIEGDAVVVETHHFHHGHQLSLMERIRLSDDGKRLSYMQEVVGPKPEQQHRHSMEFDVS